MADKFTWVETYKKIAVKLKEFRDNQKDLLDLLLQLKNGNLPTLSLFDKDSDGSSIPLSEIDPFTFFANFNRGIKTETRIKIIGRLIEEWNLTCALPTDFSGIPVVNNLQAWFFTYKKDRGENDILLLWDLFEQALEDQISEQTFDAVLNLKYIHYNITMGLFWISPDRYLNLDSVNRSYLAQNGLHIKELSSFKSYIEYMEQTKRLINKPFFQISYDAWLQNTDAVRYWQIAPGENARLWKDFTDNSIVAVGWPKLDFNIGNLTKKELFELYKSNYPEATEHKAKVNATQLSNFTNLTPGDRIVTNKGKTSVLGIGTVSESYSFQKEREEYKHTVPVKYDHLSQEGIPLPEKFKGKFGKTILELSQEEFHELEELFIDRTPPPEDSKNYWWLNANPKIWDFYDSEVGARQSYTARNEKGNKRQKYKYFEKIKPGDKIILYIASPVKEVSGLCAATTGLRTIDGQEAFEFEIVEQYKNTVHWSDLQSNPALKNCEPLLNNQGSLFSLTRDEFETIQSIIDEMNIPEGHLSPYTIQEALKDLFLDQNAFAEIVDRLRHKKNIILQGPPGVGKTFIAKRLAFFLMGVKGDQRLSMIQFHQSYSYEDFIQGFRPNSDGKFELKNGIFYEFCRKAQRDAGNKYFFIIDEINRGNMSKIFGEMLMLIESDKRGPEFAVPLTYSTDPDHTFFIPSNIYIIGTMNTADRSLAMVDYALRRRFAFIDLKPMFESDSFRTYLAGHNVDSAVIVRLVDRMAQLNKTIAADTRNLGVGYRIGHSYFCPSNKGESFDESWYRKVILTEIEPLLREYWFDDPDKVRKQVEYLLS